MKYMPDLKDWFQRRKPNQHPYPLVQIRPELLSSIEKIAAHENTPVGAVVNDLLRFALAERRVSHATLETWQQLTEREKEITALIWMGLTNPEIADRLVISPNTVKTHIRNIFAKFNLNSKEDLRIELASLDFSEWVDTWASRSQPPTTTDSPHEATP